MGHLEGMANKCVPYTPSWPPATPRITAAAFSEHPQTPVLPLICTLHLNVITLQLASKAQRELGPRTSLQQPHP